VVQAILDGAEQFQPQRPDTIARSIAIGNPADGPYAIRVVRDSGGSGASATDPEILDAIELLARTQGIFTEPAGGTTLAATIKLIENGTIPRDESICVCITGNGLKTIEVQAGRLPSVPVIAARPEALAAVVEGTPARAGTEKSGAAAPRGAR
jgi:threonine synthase